MPPPSRSLLYRAAHAAAEAAELFSRAVRPAAAMASMPFTGAPQGQGNAPPPDYSADQPPPATSPLERIAGYHDRTYRATGQPIGVGGFDVSRMRGAIEVHDTGASFLGTSLFASAATRFAPVHTALAQCVAPVMDLPRYIRGGDKGLAQIVKEEIEAQLCPEAGAYSSPYFPTTLWGSLAVEVSMMNFAVLQHVDGDPDPETNVRPRYSRRWPVFGVTCDMWRKTYRANTTEGPIDILNDGKFTLLADEDLPHLNSPIRALGSPVMSGVLANQARDQYINLYGNPKPIGEMPANVGVETPEGRLFFQSMSDFRNPGGLILLPNGAKVTFAQLEGRTSTVFKDTSESVWNYIAAVLLGSEGTMTLGSGGVYTSPTFAKVARSISARRLRMIVRGINDGHCGPYVDFNYAAGRTASKKVGAWKQPVLDIPIQDPDREARIKGEIDRAKALTDQLAADAAVGAPAPPERIAYLAKSFETDPIVITGKALPPIYEWEAKLKLFSPDEIRARKGEAPLPGKIGGLDRLAEERARGIDETGKTTITEAKPPPGSDAAPTDSAPAAPAEETATP